MPANLFLTPTDGATTPNTTTYSLMTPWGLFYQGSGTGGGGGGPTFLPILLVIT